MEKRKKRERIEYSGLIFFPFILMPTPVYEFLPLGAVRCPRAQNQHRTKLRVTKNYPMTNGRFDELLHILEDEKSQLYFVKELFLIIILNSKL